MSIEDDIDNAIRDYAVGPGMCQYPSWGSTDRGSRDSTGWTETRGSDVRGCDEAAAEIDRLSAEAAKLVRDQIAHEVARRLGPDEPATWSLAPDEIELLASIRRDRVWRRRVARWFRRSGS